MNETKQMVREEAIVGRRVVARTRDGEISGKVLSVVSREKAEKIMESPRRIRPGKYLIIDGVDYPIRRARCRLLPEARARR